MAQHNEVEFERELCEHLATNGWLDSPNDDGYDRQRALFPDDVFAWLARPARGAGEAVEAGAVGVRS